MQPDNPGAIAEGYMRAIGERNFEEAGKYLADSDFNYTDDEVMGSDQRNQHTPAPYKADFTSKMACLRDNNSVLER